MRTLTTSIEINSTADEVWKHLMDFDAYPEWNPFILEISGVPTVGSTLTARLQNPGGKAMSFDPIVTRVDADSHFSWSGKLGLKGIFDGHHRFDIGSTANGTVLFTQSEEFSGALVPLLWRMVNTKTRSGFEEMNRALKVRVEDT